MLLPVLGVPFSNLRIINDQQVLGVGLFRCLREVERPGDDDVGVCYANDRLPIIEWMRATPMDPAIRQAIAEGNAKGLLGLS